MSWLKVNDERPHATGVWGNPYLRIISDTDEADLMDQVSELLASPRHNVISTSNVQAAFDGDGLVYILTVWVQRRRIDPAGADAK